MISIIAVVVMVALAYWARAQTRRDFVAYISSTTVVRSDIATSGNRVHVTDDTARQGSVAQTTISLQNSGRREIYANDFEKDMLFIFMNVDTLYSACIRKRHPDDISPHVSIKGDTIIVAKCLFNAADQVWLEVQSFSHSDMYPIIDPRIRIAGISEVTIRNFNNEAGYDDRFISVLVYALLISVLALILYEVVTAIIGGRRTRTGGSYPT